MRLCFLVSLNIRSPDGLVFFSQLEKSPWPAESSRPRHQMALCFSQLEGSHGLPRVPGPVARWLRVLQRTNPIQTTGTLCSVKNPLERLVFIASEHKRNGERQFFGASKE